MQCVRIVNALPDLYLYGQCACVCVCKHLVRYTDCYCRITYALSYIILYVHDMCIYDDESMHRESRLVDGGGGGGDAGAGEPEKKPVTSIALRTHIIHRSGAVAKKHSVGGMLGGGVHGLASRPPRRLAHPNYWAPANCPTPGPAYPLAYNATRYTYDILLYT